MAAVTTETYAEAALAPIGDGQLSAFAELLPCMAFLERDGLIVSLNSLARTATCVRDDGPIALERVFLGAFPFAERLHAATDFVCLVLTGNGNPLVVQGAVRPVSAHTRLILAVERRDASASEGSFLGDLLDSAPEAIAITHEGRLLHVNREFTRLFGFVGEHCVGEDIDMLLLPDGRQHEMEMLRHMLATDRRGSIETVRKTSTGELVDVSLLVAPVKLSGSTLGMYFTFRDIRLQKEQEARLHHNAMHDGLTGLANRALFLDRLRLTLARLKRRPDRHFAVMFLDLDRFKQVNDTLGHDAGDKLLLEATRRIIACVRPQDTVARFGGDEFAVLLDEAGSRADVERVAERIQIAIQRPVAYAGKEVLVSASIGVAVVTPGYHEAESVVRDADLAMYQAKAAGKACHAFAKIVGVAAV